MSERLPVESLNLQSSLWSTTSSVVRSGRSVSNIEQVVRSDGGGAWTSQMTFAINNEDVARRWRSLTARMRGGEVAFEIPYKQIGATVQLVGKPDTSPAPFSDGAFFSDGAGFVISPAATGVFDEPALLRASTVTVRFDSAVTVLGGEVFSVVYESGVRMHTIERISSQTGNTYTLVIDPPLREEVTTNTVLDFDNPRCLMRLTRPGGMDSEFRNLRRTNPTVGFVEKLGT